jgi:hypothetical protein
MNDETALPDKQDDPNWHDDHYVEWKFTTEQVAINGITQMVIRGWCVHCEQRPED